MAKFKVGDRIKISERIRDWKGGRPGVSEPMVGLIGEEGTIKFITHHSYGYYILHLDEKRFGGWTWTEDMVDRAEDEEMAEAIAFIRSNR